METANDLSIHQAPNTLEAGRLGDACSDGKRLVRDPGVLLKKCDDRRIDPGDLRLRHEMQNYMRVSVQSIEDALQ